MCCDRICLFKINNYQNQVPYSVAYSIDVAQLFITIILEPFCTFKILIAFCHLTLCAIVNFQGSKADWS